MNESIGNKDANEPIRSKIYKIFYIALQRELEAYSSGKKDLSELVMTVMFMLLMLFAVSLVGIAILALIAVLF